MLIPRHEVTELSNPGKFIPAHWQILGSPPGSLFKKCEEEVSYEERSVFGFDNGTIGKKFTNFVVGRGIA
jgi:hypothetical protein